MIAHNPLPGSGQAGFPHPALALGEDADASRGIGRTDSRHRQPASEEAPHAIPQNAAFVAAPRKRAMPEPPYLALGELGISRFPRKVSPYVHGSLYRAGLWHTSRYRCIRWRLPPAPTASASRSTSLTRLNTRPHVPLSTLRRCHCKQLRMTRGRCGSLLHIRMTFAFTTPRRFSQRTGETK